MDKLSNQTALNFTLASSNVDIISDLKKTAEAVLDS
jgi:hypothetical protein